MTPIARVTKSREEDLDEVPGLDPIPRVQIINITIKPGETVTWRAFSDLHLDENLCDRSFLIQQARRDREQFGNVRALCFGDITNLVFAVDAKRYAPSVTRNTLARRDQFVKAAVRSCGAFLEKLNYKWDLISEGNHEKSATKHYGADVAGDLAEHLGCVVGGVSGAVDFRFTIPHGTDGKFSTRARIRFIYTHGNWGGESAGYMSAKRWAFQYDDWDAMFYGHNHKCFVRPEVRLSIDGNNIREKTVFIVNCGSAARSYGHDARETHYGELKCYPREPIISPIIQFTPRHLHGRLKTSFSATVERQT